MTNPEVHEINAQLALSELNHRSGLLNKAKGSKLSKIFGMFSSLVWLPILFAWQQWPDMKQNKFLLISIITAVLVLNGYIHFIGQRIDALLKLLGEEKLLKK